MTRTLRIGIDLDGVCADYVGSVIQADLAAGRSGTRFTSADVDSYDALPRLLDFATWQEMYDWLDGMDPRRFGKLSTIPGTTSALQALAEAGHQLVIITARPDHSRADTLAWLGRHHIPAAEVHITLDKTKVPRCDVYLDDAAHNLQALKNAHPGAVVVRRIQPWNSPMLGIPAVSDWGQFLRLVEEVASWPDPRRAPLVVGLRGRKQHGKDTTAQTLIEEYGFRRISFADRLKSLAYALDPDVKYDDGRPGSLCVAVDWQGWDVAKERHPGIRSYLQNLGVAAREHIHNDVWVQAALADIKPGERIVVTDVRFPNESAAIKTLGGTIAQVHRPGMNDADLHISETALDHEEPDHFILNNGSVEDLATEARKLAGSLGL